MPAWMAMRSTKPASSAGRGTSPSERSPTTGSVTDTELSATIDDYQRGFTFLRDPRFVSVAAVQGYAIGAGFQLALSCDLRVVAEGTQFCMKETALGLVPDLTGGVPAGALAATAYIGVQLLSIARHMAVLEIGIPAPLRGILLPPGEKES